MSCRIKSCHVIFSSYTLADVHTHLEKDFITLEITLPNDQPQYCFIFGLRDHFVDTYPEHPVISREFSYYYFKKGKKVMDLITVLEAILTGRQRAKLQRLYGNLRINTNRMAVFALVC